MVVCTHPGTIRWDFHGIFMEFSWDPMVFLLDFMGFYVVFIGFDLGDIGFRVLMGFDAVLVGIYWELMGIRGDIYVIDMGCQYVYVFVYIYKAMFVGFVPFIIGFCPFFGALPFLAQGNDHYKN